ncbi:hypothetical protein TNCV_4201641 [Trichonephila clavipes]|uniref:Uncharacterized protein n=1 Tax=Trichonephila clavipes TaxID=2585209 RepID=A0A8X6WD20_TRICX|nr:hypothetical protein TNCV_4201641 [Trichonephila clavipes]
MPYPGFETSPYDTAVSVTNHSTEWAVMLLNSIPKEDFRSSFQNMYNSSQRCIAMRGDYFERQKETQSQSVVEPPSLEEVIEAVNKLEDNKAPSPDTIPSELLKKGENGMWRRRSNLELYQSYEESGIVNFIKIQQIKWAGHVRMDENQTTKKVFNAQQIGTQRKGRPSLR